jgi:hypothetical protein
MDKFMGQPKGQWAAEPTEDVDMDSESVKEVSGGSKRAETVTAAATLTQLLKPQKPWPIK